jgi:dienelactone hydrolase
LLSWALVRRDLQHFLVKRIPPLRLPEKGTEWERTCAELRERVLSEVVYAGLPEAVIEEKPRVEWGETLRPGPGYSLRKLRYESFPGMWAPALLYCPEGGEGKAPAVLNVNGHVGPPGKSDGAEQLRCINLAKRGMIALHPEWIGCGELGCGENAHNNLAYLDLCGQSGLAVFYLHIKRALDILLDVPGADPERVAMTGLSGGGWQTILFSSLDPRVKAAIPNAGYIGLLHRIFGNPGDTGDVEQNPNDLLTVADYDQLTALLAPRPALLIFNAYDECCFTAHRALPSVYHPVKPLYRQLRAEGDFEYHVNEDPGTHNYDADNRKALYRFLNKHFLGGKGQEEEIESTSEVLTFEQLKVGIPPDNANLISLARELARDLPQERVRTEGGWEFSKWRDGGRERLKQVLRYQPLPPLEARLLQEEMVEDRRVRCWELRADGAWRLPAVEYGPPGDGQAPVALVVADGGREASAQLVEGLWREGNRVIAFDVLFTGEMAPPGMAPWQFAMMLAAVGARPLGLQVAQIEAVRRWALDKSPDRSLFALGRGLSVAAVAAAALDAGGETGRLVTRELPASLKLLFEENVGYHSCAPLFCFGLLKEFDIRELLALCAGREVECGEVWGGPARVEAELGGLGKLFSLAGGESRFSLAAAESRA